LSRRPRLKVAGPAEIWLARLQARRGLADPPAQESWARIAAEQRYSARGAPRTGHGAVAVAPTLPHALQLGAILAASGAAAEELVELAARLPDEEQPQFLDTLAQHRFQAHDWPAAVR